MIQPSSFIISLKNAVANWYARLQPRSITSLGQLKEKFLVNFQGFQTKLSTEEDFLSCQPYERETLSDFFRRFFHLKAQAPEVSNDQVITQALKALRVGQLHNYLVREHPKTHEESYDNFRTFIRSKVLHFCNLDQQRKVSKENESSRPTKYSKSRESISNFDIPYMQIHINDSD
jgi:hypothetical protein